MKTVTINPYQCIRYALLFINAYVLGLGIWTRDWATVAWEGPLTGLIAWLIHHNAQPKGTNSNDDEAGTP